MCFIEEYEKMQVNAASEYDFARIQRKDVLMADLCIEKTEDGFTFTYDIKDLMDFEWLKKQDRKYKLKAIYNFAEIQRKCEEFLVLAEETNFRFDLNARTKILFRDIRKNDDNGNAFIEIYRAFAGALLCTEYSMKELLNGGLSILKCDNGKEKRHRLFTADSFLKKALEFETVEEIKNAALEEYRAIEKYEKENLRTISRRGKIIRNITTIVSAVLATICVSLFLYFYFAHYRIEKQVVLANEAFISKNYVDCIDELKDVGVDVMSTNTKYILSFSYAKTENLRQSEITGLTERLSLLTSTKELEYWIYLERGEYDNAYDRAMALSDDQLLIYAYMKELDYLNTNTDIPGEEKQTRIEELQNEIEKLGKKYGADKQ